MSNSKFHHEEIYRGQDLVSKLSKTHITVCGCGALGSNLIDSLVRQGFSRIRVIDKDRVETQNLNTQTFDEADVGAQKVAAVRNKAFKAVGVEIEVEGKELTSANIKKMFKGTNLVVDAFDNTASRRLIQDYCKQNKIPCVHSGLFSDYSEVVWNEDYSVPNDSNEDVCDYPLTRNLVYITVGIVCEEIVDFCLSKTPRKQNWAFTLKDLKIGEYR